ncbi:MAG: universal stress protein [Chloroflexaceae bacterium]|nr:universal stress protein [Chloroflexaceae bacterium]
MNQPFTAAPHDDILVWLIQLAVLLFTARVLGSIMSRLGQPSVLGEIMAGIVIGPSLLSGLFPALGMWLIPQNAVQGYLLEQTALIGAMFMLLFTGLEIDVGLIRRYARVAISTSAGGLFMPFSLGFVLATFFIPDALLADPEQRLVFSLFLATALAICALPVIAKVLLDLNALRRDIGQMVIASAMIDDLTAWTMLSIVVGMASGTAISVAGVATSVLSVVGFMVFSFTAGRWIVAKTLAFAQNRLQGRDVMLSMVVGLMFAWGSISHFLHIEAIIGAFVMGILLGQTPGVPEDVIHKLEGIALGVFAPIFFATAGLKVNVGLLFEPQLILLTLVIIAVAMIGKISGAYLGARFLGRRDHWTALSFGVSLSARGAVEIIIATIGLSAGVLSQEVFSMIVVMAIVTSLVAPPMMRWAYSRVPISPEEEARLRREALLKDNLVANVHRVLVPVRVRQDEVSAIQMIEASLLKRLGANTDMAITLMTIATPETKAQATTYLADLSKLFGTQRINRKVSISSNPTDAILDEAARNYDLMVLGAPQQGSRTDVLFTPMVDLLIRLAPCPTMVIHSPDLPDNWSPQRMLVPTNGSIAARRAAEVGFALAAGTGVAAGNNKQTAEVRVLKVVEDETYQVILATHDSNRQVLIAYQIVNELAVLGESFGVRVIPDVVSSPEYVHAILVHAHTCETDLIILGISVRTGSHRLYLGPRVERILQEAPCPVVIINTVTGTAPANSDHSTQARDAEAAERATPPR